MEEPGILGRRSGVTGARQRVWPAVWYERSMRARTRRWILGAAAIIAASAGLVVLGLVVIYPRMGAWYLERRVVPRLEARLGREVAIGDVDVSLGRAVLRDVTVRGPGDGGAPLVRLDRVEITFDTWSSFLARARVHEVVVRGGQIAVRRAGGGTSNVDDLRARLTGGADHDGGAGARPGGGMGRLRPERASFDGISLELVDEGRDLRGGAAALAGTFVDGRAQLVVETIGVDAALGSWLRAGLGGGVADLDADLGDGLEAEAEGADPAATPDAGVTAPARAAASRVFAVARVTVTADDDGRRAVVEGGELTPWSGLNLTGVTGTVTEVEAGGARRLAIALEGGYGGVAGRLWTASGWLDPAGEAGELALEAERFSLERLRPSLEHSSLVDYQATTVDAALTVQVARDVVTFAGGFHLHDLTVGHPMLAERPVPDLDVSGDIAGSIDRTSRTLALTRGDFVTRELPFRLTGTLALPGGRTPAGATRSHLAVAARLVVPPIDCQRALAAFPPEMTPYMQGYKLRGKFSTDLRVAVDLGDLEATLLDGSVAIRNCRILETPVEMKRLLASFEHYVELERDQWLAFVVGPENPDFVPLAEVSPHLLNSFMTTEDSAFYQHKGFIVREFRTALIKNLAAGYFKYGASSITMQTVKNVLLYREKTLSRKLQELFLTYSIEQVLDKDRIFEIYVNAIEYGPGLYGIGPAARHYFGKAPRDLTPTEAAFFSSILPSPKARYRQYCKGTLTRWTDNKIDRILALMRKRGRLTEDEYQAAVAQPLVFVKDGTETEDQCMKRVSRALKNARPTNPLKK